MKTSCFGLVAAAAIAVGLFGSGCVSSAPITGNKSATVNPTDPLTLTTMSATPRSRASMIGVPLMRDFEVSAGATNTNYFMGVITVHLTTPVFGTQYIELNFYEPGRHFAYYQDGRFHLGYGSEMFGAIHAMLRSERTIYFYFDERVLQGLDPHDHSAPAEFGFLTTQPSWPY